MPEAQPGRGAGEPREYRVDNDDVPRNPRCEQNGLPQRPRLPGVGEQGVSGEYTKGRSHAPRPARQAQEQRAGNHHEAQAGERDQAPVDRRAIVGRRRRDSVQADGGGLQLALQKHHRRLQELTDEEDDQTAQRGATRSARPIDPRAQEEEEARRAEMRYQASQKREGAVVSAHGAGPEFGGVLAGDEGAGMVDRHEDHDESAKSVDGMISPVHSKNRI